MTEKKMKPTLESFASSIGWSISNYFLNKTGVKRHHIEIVTLPEGPCQIYQNKDFTDNHSGDHHINRQLHIGNIGILCSSDTKPCLREIVISVSLDSSLPIMFGEKCTLRDGFRGENKYGEGYSYICRKDYTLIEDEKINESKLLVLSAGNIYYPFRYKRTNLFHEIYKKKYFSNFYEETFYINDIEEDDFHKISNAYDNAFKKIAVHIGVLLDNTDVLAFKWNYEKQCFEEAFLNTGIVTA